VDDYIPIKTAGSVDTDLLDDSRSGIEATLRARGYWKARVEYTQTRPSPDRLLIVYDITPGKRYRVVRVALPAGLQVTDADVAQDALKTGAYSTRQASECAPMSKRIAQKGSIAS
jgi:outer membrane protein assembly factor BamA